ncbi:MAG: hypothetical protein ACI8RZ_005425 [Myxococcota bacterium]|jgi:hypothetical protein
MSARLQEVGGCRRCAAAPAGCLRAGEAAGPHRAGPPGRAEHARAARVWPSWPWANRTWVRLSPDIRTMRGSDRLCPSSATSSKNRTDRSKSARRSAVAPRLLSRRTHIGRSWRLRAMARTWVWMASASGSCPLMPSTAPSALSTWSWTVSSGSSASTAEDRCRFGCVLTGQRLLRRSHSDPLRGADGGGTAPGRGCAASLAPRSARRQAHAGPDAPETPARPAPARGHAQGVALPGDAQGAEGGEGEEGGDHDKSRRLTGRLASGKSGTVAGGTVGEASSVR